MDRISALQALGLDSSASAEQIESACDRRDVELDQRLSSAPTDALRAKYQKHKQELAQLRQLALRDDPVAESSLSQTQIRDLPGATPSYTQDGSHKDAPGSKIYLSEGQVLADRYEIRRRIGAGGMGAVFAAFDRNRDKEIAIEVLLPGLMEDEGARERFLNEAKVSSELSHPNIVNVFDVQKDNTLHFLTMELLEGVTLRQKMEALESARQQFDVEEVVRIGESLCDALSYAHQYTVHRDIKPENIFLCDDGTVKLMDFGIARLLRVSQLTMTGMSMGTAYYMAPEQLKGNKEIKHQADQYSLAVVLYEMLVGEVPAGRIESAVTRRKETPKSLSQALDKALSAQPESRYADIDAFRASLTRRSMSLPKGKARIVAAAILLLVGIGVSAPLWLGPIKSLIADATRDPAAEQATRNAKADALTAQETWTSISELLLDQPEPSEIGQASLALTAGDDQLSKEDYGSAQTSYEQATTLYTTVLTRLDDQFREKAIASQGEAEALSKKLEGIQRSLDSRVRDVQSETQRHESSLRFAKGAERDQVEQQLQQSKSEQVLIGRWVSLCQTHLFGGSDYLSLAGNLKLAEAQLREKQYVQASLRLDEAKTLMQTMLKWPQDAESALRQQALAKQELSTLQGKLGPVATKLSGVSQGLSKAMGDLRQGDTSLSQGEPAAASGAYQSARQSLKPVPNEAVNGLLLISRANASAEKATTAFAALDDLDRLVPSHAEAKSLRARMGTMIRDKRISDLLATAKANDDEKDEAKQAAALLALSELLKLDSKHVEALSLKDRISHYGFAGPGKSITNSVKMKLLEIKPGKFYFGEGDGLKVLQLKKGFYVGVTEVTQAQWTTVMGTTPWKRETLTKESPDYAASELSWDDAVAFCKKLSQKEGKTYRLLTEEEWECVCRAGTKTKYSFGDNEGELGNYAWFEKNAAEVGEEYAHRVAQKKPNPWGLYDVHGNVWEWCSDWYEVGSSRVLRGGGLGNDADICHSTFRNSGTPDGRFYDRGFRIGLDLPE